MTDFDRAPRFWDFYQQKGEPFWGTGLFRYLDDETAGGLLDAVSAVAVRE